VAAAADGIDPGVAPVITAAADAIVADEIDLVTKVLRSSLMLLSDTVDAVVVVVVKDSVNDVLERPYGCTLQMGTNATERLNKNDTAEMTTMKLLFPSFIIINFIVTKRFFEIEVCSNCISNDKRRE
jgi:hypothetical protein